MEKHDDSCLEDLKKSYLEIQSKYTLPDFDKLNRDFQIEKISQEETDYLIREVRKYVADKLANYMRLIESILNPVSVPIFVFSIIKTLQTEDKNKLTEIYKKLSKNEINLIEMDLELSEEKEAEFIKNSCKIWDEIKIDLIKIVEVIKNNWDTKFGVNHKGYFG
jgi:hypothetical protein